MCIQWSPHAYYGWHKFYITYLAYFLYKLYAPAYTTHTCCINTWPVCTLLPAVVN